MIALRNSPTPPSPTATEASHIVRVQVSAAIAAKAIAT